MKINKLSPDLTSAAGLSFREVHHFSGSLGYRYVKDRPANEDNSIVAKGYFVTDSNLNYSIKNWTLGLIVENLFDTEWNETQFATESRLFIVILNGPCTIFVSRTDFNFQKS